MGSLREEGPPFQKPPTRSQSLCSHWPDGVGLMESGHRVFAAWIEEAGVGLPESFLPSVFARSLRSSAQQGGEEISCPPIEDTGSGGERAFPKPTARKAWPSAHHPLERRPGQASCLPRVCPHCLT